VTPSVFRRDSKISDAGFELFGFIICSAYLSGCGIIPTTFPALLEMPAMPSDAPLTYSA